MSPLQVQTAPDLPLFLVAWKIIVLYSSKPDGNVDMLISRHKQRNEFGNTKKWQSHFWNTFIHEQGCLRDALLWIWLLVSLLGWGCPSQSSPPGHIHNAAGNRPQLEDVATWVYRNKKRWIPKRVCRTPSVPGQKDKSSSLWGGTVRLESEKSISAVALSTTGSFIRGSKLKSQKSRWGSGKHQYNPTLCIVDIMCLHVQFLHSK